MQDNNRRIATRLDLAVCAFTPCLLTVLTALAIRLTDTPPLFLLLLSAFLYIGVLYFWALFRKKSASVSGIRHTREFFDGEIERAVLGIRQPALVCDEVGEILWCNGMLIDALGRRDLVVGADLNDVCSLSPDALEENDRIVAIGEQLYRFEGVRLDKEGAPLWFLLFTDCTELEQTKTVYANETPIVAYIMIDNLQELLQYVQDTYASATASVENTVREWIHGMGGIMQAYEKDRYVAFFDNAHLRACMQERFDVLDEVRSVRVGDGVPVTVSVGISSMGKTLEERSAYAKAALDMALTRGGDQVVVRLEGGDRFFGGKTKAVQKSVPIRSPVAANELAGILTRVNSVLIMGHRFGDFDSFGAAVGMARFCMLCGVQPHIVVNRNDPNLPLCFEKLSGIPDYDDIFIDGNTGLDCIRPDTLLIIVDVNNIEHTECPDIAHSVKQLVIIDHHRKTTEYETEPLISYIEPSASSASELVSEILEQRTATRSLCKEEAELLLAGIQLDSKQFTRNAGTRTFAAAQYLRGEGAMPDESSNLFRSEVDDLTKEARFHSNVIVYKERFAISYVDDDADESYRVIAAKAADKLLTLRGISAAITLVAIGNKVHVSARSDGSINVQLILEALNGGGHYDVAGAQVAGESLQNVLLKLRQAIDRYADQ